MCGQLLDRWHYRSGNHRIARCRSDLCRCATIPSATPPGVYSLLAVAQRRVDQSVDRNHVHSRLTRAAALNLSVVALLGRREIFRGTALVLRD